MKILEVTQGSPEWHAARAKCFCASEAPAMMGVSPYMTRDELLRRKATGDTPDIDPATQALYDRGHAAEAAARVHVEKAFNQELYPATVTSDDGRMLASLDGVTMDGDFGFEHKLWREDLAAAVCAGDIPPAYYWQLEHQILVAGLKRVLFVCSDGTIEHTASFSYAPVPGRAEQLIAGWKQFEEDLKNYQHVEVLPPPTAAPTMGLPALSIQVNGSITLTDNLKVFGERLEAFIAGIDKNPSTDQAFADCEAAVKTLEKAQQALEAAEAGALAQTASIDEMRRTVSLYANQARSTRLMLEKLVKARKETIREEIRREGIDAFSQHVAMLNTRLGKPYMPVIQTDFGGMMRGKKTLTSLRDAVNTELARAKIEANAVADRVQINLNTLRDIGKDHAFLFADAAQIVLKQPDDLAALVKMRIAEHKESEAKRLEAEREKIRQEEAAKLLREQQAKETAAVPAQPQSGAPSRVQHPEPAPVAAPVGTSKLRGLIADGMADMSPGELQQVLDHVRSIRAERKAVSRAA